MEKDFKRYPPARKVGEMNLLQETDGCWKANASYASFILEEE